MSKLKISVFTIKMIAGGCLLGFFIGLFSIRYVDFKYQARALMDFQKPAFRELNDTDLPRFDYERSVKLATELVLQDANNAMIQACLTSNGVSRSIAPVKGVSSLLEIKILANSSEIAEDCLENTIKEVSKIQNLQLDEYKNQIQDRIQFYETSLRELNGYIEKTDPSLSVISLNYLLINSKYLDLNSKLMELKGRLASVSKNNFKLIMPISKSQKPIYPSKVFIVLCGMICGCILGFLLSFADFRKIF